MVRKPRNQPTAQGQSTQQVSLTEEERKEFFEQRKLYIDLQQQASDAFDKTVVTLAGGALGLSLTFIRQIVPEVMQGTIIHLALAWVFLILCLLASLLSLFTSQLGMIRACAELEEAYKIGTKPIKMYIHWLPKAYKWLAERLYSFFGHRATTHFLNVAAIGFLVIGVGMLAWFVILNIPQLQAPLKP